MHQTTWSLPQFATLNRVKVSTALEQLYLVEPDLLPEKMDPLFFNNKDNFVPHQYPCRKQFRADNLDRLPTNDVSLITDQYYVNNSNPKVEFSSFWFYPTYVKRKASTIIISPETFNAEFCLKSPGGVQIWVNGKSVGGIAQYLRNLEQQTMIQFPLQQGENQIEIIFDDLCERDTVYYFELQYLTHIMLTQKLMFQINEHLVKTLEQNLLNCYFEKDTQLTGDLILHFPQPLPCDIEFNYQTHHEFILPPTHKKQQQLKKEEQHVNLGAISHYYDCYNIFNLSFSIADFSLHKEIGVETLNKQRQPSYHEQLKDRQQACLDYYAQYGYQSPPRLLAQLTLENATPDFQQIEQQLILMENKGDCADFYLIPSFWMLLLYKDKLPKTFIKRLEQIIINFRYWCDEPGNDVMWYYSENHALLFHTNQMLAGIYFPEEIFTVSKRKGSEQYKLALTRLHQWFDHFEQWEMAEFNSAPYFPIDLIGITTIAKFSPDEKLKQRAYHALYRLLSLIAYNSHQGYLTAAQGRSYEKDLIPSRSLEVNSVNYLLTGKTWIGANCFMMPMLCLLDWTLDQTLQSFIFYQQDNPILFENTQAENHFAQLINYKTKDYTLSSVKNYRVGQRGYQETLCHLRMGLKAEAQIWFNHPGEEIEFGFKRPSYWGGSRNLPTVVQYHNMAFLKFKTLTNDLPYSHAWFPSWAFDEIEVIENDYFVRVENSVLRLSAFGHPLTTIKKGQYVTELRNYNSSDSENYWFIKLAALNNLSFNEWITIERQNNLTCQNGDLCYQTATSIFELINCHGYLDKQPLPDHIQSILGRHTVVQPK